MPFDRTTGVIGPQGSGKTLDLLTPALLSRPGAALVTLTKAEDLLLTLDARSAAATGRSRCSTRSGWRPGLPELVWDPIAGCVDPMVAERRAKAFTAGTVKGAVARGTGDDAARFYAAEAAKVLQAYFHAAALTGRTLEDVLDWVANPRRRHHPRGDPAHPPARRAVLARAAARRAARRRPHRRQHHHHRAAGDGPVLPGRRPAAAASPAPAGRPPTSPTSSPRGGTIYLLGRDDPYASASPLMTAVAEHVLDTALQLANASPWGRLCPPFLACLDELPSTAPLPTLRTRMANERALGSSFIYAAQTWRQLVISTASTRPAPCSG